MAKLAIIYLSISTLIDLSLSSKCPEPRKPHATSCTIFYNCVNLPGGGYVWAPAKCTDGLLFQPYLRICVLPGDSWTCDIPETEKSGTTPSQLPELIDSTQTSYLTYGGDDDASRFSDPLDYYKIDKYTEPVDVTLDQTVTPYPLIEVTQPNNYVNQIDTTIKNLGLPIAIKHSEDNYLYHFVNGQQVLSTPINANNEQLQAHLERLTQLIERLTAYQGLGIPLDRQVESTVSTTTSTTTPSPANFNNFPNENQETAINYLIKNYILKSQTQGTKSIISNSFSDHEATTAAMNNLNLDIINGQQNSNNIIMVKDSLNNRQYFTIGKYKSIAHQLTTEVVELIPCTNGIRHANATDCTKYYSCEPATAKIRQFSCPSNTAFNKYKRLCESHEFVLCMSEEEESGGESTSRNRETSIMAESVSEKSPCDTVGKHPDPNSKNHYYLCFSSNGKSTDLKYQRMECPNNLIFCEDKNVCTTRKRCDNIN